MFWQELDNHMREFYENAAGSGDQIPKEEPICRNVA